MKKKTFLSVFGWMGPGCFLLEPIKKFSPQNGKKTEGRKWDCLMDKNAHVQFLSSSSSFFFFFGAGHVASSFSFLFFFSFLSYTLLFFLFSFFDFFGCGWAHCLFFFLFFPLFFSILSWTLPPFLFLFWGVVGVIVVFFCFFV